MTRSRTNHANIHKRRSVPVLILTTLVGLASVGGLGACRGPKPDRTSVTGTFALYMGISTRGNYDAMYPLLVPQIRKMIADAHSNTLNAVRLIEDRFPRKMKADALKKIGSPAVRSARTPDRYLAALMDVTGRPALDIKERLASKIKWINEVVPGTFKVTTVSGATLKFVRGGDKRFYLVPTPRDAALIRQDYMASMKNLEDARKAVETIDR